MPTASRIFTRARLIAVVAVAVAAMLVATVFIVQANASRAESVAATDELSQAGSFNREQLTAYPVIAKARADHRAERTLGEANQVLAAVANKVDATRLQTSVASLAHYSSLSAFEVRSLTVETEAATRDTQVAAAETDRLAAEAAAAAAEALRAANTPDGARAIAREMAASQYGWGESEFSCLDQLWQKESGWSVSAMNASSGATGIPQALPGSKMASAGPDWATSAATQISWGLGYIAGGYGTPCSAWGHSSSMNWY
ncbi:hypothetical protein [Glaciibacter superstes]|uniref:aggregation-promoting factor C-terminal-like domain-containing protein n=1 Tax=Glaciibacter superstes TaxID=501023 RepID=UPI0003B39C9C|nr:hypothetical protein [Glaciibacter superstes]